MLLEKDPKLRPSVSEILKMDFIKQRMIDFVKNGGNTLGPNQELFKREEPVYVCHVE